MKATIALTTGAYNSRLFSTLSIVLSVIACSFVALAKKDNEGRRITKTEAQPKEQESKNNQ